MVVTQDVKAGTLLAVCNPLAIACIGPSELGFLIDPVNMTLVGFSLPACTLQACNIPRGLHIEGLCVL